MVKVTCTGRNLLNHCKQIGNPSDINYNIVRYNDYKENTNEVQNYNSIKNPGSSYICTLTFDNKKYIAAASSKRGSVDAAVYYADGALRAFI